MTLMEMIKQFRDAGSGKVDVYHEGGELKDVWVGEVGDESAVFTYRTSPASRLERKRIVPYRRILYIERAVG